jgi:predicted metal-dependent phosphoesterase TrpH
VAKRRGMDFVTITDHDTIAGALELAHLPDTFIAEELTAWFKNEPQAVHVLCFGINPDDHEWLQAHRGDVEACADYLHAHETTAALAHPFYAVEAPLTARHRRRLARLFPIWETRNGSRAKELNLQAFVYIETHGGRRSGAQTTTPESISGAPSRRPPGRRRRRSSLAPGSAQPSSAIAS